MRLSKAAYYADFVIYAALVLALATHVWLRGQWPVRLQWLGEFAVGMGAWTLLEYVLHRWVLHRVPFIAPMHEAHHRSPRALLGTPTWVTLAMIWIIFFLPTWWGWSFTAASGLTGGVMMGFLWYGIWHHYSRRPVNFGVTTALWDHVFGTANRAPQGIRRAPGVPQ
jgi:sterol desaturase/sphingolipid hydroxylase (fatty acid hydroxylase superfamily)